MDSMKTYAIGDRAIELTDREAETLRIILQREYIRSVINDIIDDEADVFHFDSVNNRARFVNEFVNMCDDYIDLSGGHEETLWEAVYGYARDKGIAR